jgi:alcohol dehydrogenase
MLNRFIVPYGGLLRGRLSAGETVVMTGATGAYGTAAVLLALAMGAARVVAAGRSAAALDVVAKIAASRIVPVRLAGDARADTAALREAAGGGADLAFDMVGQAGDANATLAALNSLRRGGRLVLMGSMTVPLTLSYSDIMRNNWEIIGQFMYPASAYRRLIGLLRAGLLDIGPIRPRCFPLAALPEAMEASAGAGNLECVVVQP